LWSIICERAKTNPIKEMRVSPSARVAARLRSKPMGVYTPAPTIVLKLKKGFSDEG
jgi:hypothetical protein